MSVNPEEETVSIHRINITQNRVEYDQKCMTMMNLTDWTWPKNILISWQWQMLMLSLTEPWQRQTLVFLIIFLMGLSLPNFNKANNTKPKTCSCGRLWQVPHIVIRYSSPWFMFYKVTFSLNIKEKIREFVWNVPCI